MSHPEIGSLVRHKDEMWKHIEDGNYVMGLRKMTTILGDIKKADVPDELYDKVFNEEAKIKNTVSNKQFRRSLRLSVPAYKKWGREIVQILWDKGYLEESSYKPERKASKLKLK